ncbi:MAG: molybdate ABC transporter permease subunit [Myxococcales bacterium]
MRWDALLLSFKVASLAVCIAALLGVPLAGVMARRRFPGRDVLDVLVTAPMVLPPTVLGYYLLVVLGRSSALGGAFESLTGSSIVFRPLGAVVAATLGALPFVIKSSRAAIEDVDERLLGAARTLGAGPVRTFVQIVLPLAKGGIVAGLALGFARALGDFGVTLMVAGNIPGLTQTGSLAIYDAVQAGRDGQALGMVAVMSSLAVVLLYGVVKLTPGKRHGW